MTAGPRLLAAALAAALAAGGCAEPPVSEPPPTPVTVSPVASYATGTSERYSATVRPSVEVGLAFTLGGYVDDILTIRDNRRRERDVQEGDRVEQGAALARIRQADYEHGVAGLRSGLAEAQAMSAHAKLDFDRATRLFDQHSLTKPELDGAKARLDAMTARVEGARAALREGEIRLGDAVLRAPISGVVLSRTVERGSLVAPGTPAFVIADTSSVKAAFGVPDVVVTQLTIGRTLRLTFDALNGEAFDGRITSIAPAPDPVSRVYQVEITVPNSKHTLEVGFIASLLLADGTGQTVVTVPLEAVVKPATGADEYAVFVLDEQNNQEVARLRRVALGDVVSQAVTVTSGLTVGQKVIVRGATVLVDGQHVRVVP